MALTGSIPNSREFHYAIFWLTISPCLANISERVGGNVSHTLRFPQPCRFADSLNRMPMRSNIERLFRNTPCLLCLCSRAWKCVRGFPSAQPQRDVFWTMSHGIARLTREQMCFLCFIQKTYTATDSNLLNDSFYIYQQRKSRRSRSRTKFPGFSPERITLDKPSVSLTGSIEMSGVRSMDEVVAAIQQRKLGYECLLHSLAESITHGANPGILPCGCEELRLPLENTGLLGLRRWHCE